MHSTRTGEKLVVQENLPEPIVRDRLVLEVNNKKFGPLFKKDAQFVRGYFDQMLDCTAVQKKGDKDCDKMWDEKALMELDEKLKQGGGYITCQLEYFSDFCRKTTIKGTDGKQYEITSDLVSIYKKNEKITGNPSLCF